MISSRQRISACLLYTSTVEKEETIKDLGYIKLRTNNEIEIKIPMEEYQTKECIKVEEEPDGTKTIVMKNIEQVTVE